MERRIWIIFDDELNHLGLDGAAQLGGESQCEVDSCSLRRGSNSDVVRYKC
jgi:hypothetical protein